MENLEKEIATLNDDLMHVNCVPLLIKKNKIKSVIFAITDAHANKRNKASDAKLLRYTTAYFPCSSKESKHLQQM